MVAKIVIGLIVVLRKNEKINMEMNTKMILGAVIGSGAIFGICCLVNLFCLSTVMTAVISVALSVVSYIAIMILFKNEIIVAYLNGIRAKLRKR